MKNIYAVKATPKSPKIQGDIEKGTLHIEGKSLPEDARAFYSPFKEWLEAFYKSDATEIFVSFEFEYYNTVSSKLIWTMLQELKNISANKKVSVEWRYEKDDIEMEETGQDFKRLVGDMITLKPLEVA